MSAQERRSLDPYFAALHGAPVIPMPEDKIEIMRVVHARIQK
ncbi:hypothetical protein [Caballeronia calidae]|nr:hypothetical protein [Caballeronia calidae]